MADNPGTYEGRSYNFSGDGFSDMHFLVHAVPADQFTGWVAKTAGVGPVLDAQSYAELAKPSQAVAPFTYGSIDPGLFETIATADTPADCLWPGFAIPFRSTSFRTTARPVCGTEDDGVTFFGKLSWSAIPFNQPIPFVTSIVVILVIVLVLGWITLKGYWPYLWREWITSVDHKRIGVMYFVLALVMLLRGFSDAIMMRSQQAFAAGGAQGYLPPEHYDQIFSAHGTIMIFFMAMPLMIGLMNFVLPLQLGVRDVAFPTLNSVSFWLTASGVLLTNLSLFIGEFAKTGWMAYPPLSELRYSPGVGVDYYLWSLQISGIGTLMTGINFVTTILKMRAPGMTYMRMPVFCWTALATNLLIVAAFPVLTATFAMLLLDRYLGIPFLHRRRRRQHDDVRQSVLGVGPPGSVHPRAAGVRRLLRGDRDLLGQAAVRLSLDGRRHHGDLRPLLPGVAASLLHHGRRRRRQRLLRHHDDDHRRADGRENLQLAVHDVWRPRALSRADPVVDRLHGDLRASAA